jgi:hypothetical protein
MEEGFEKSAACFRFENELEAYLEGDSQPFITAHARECGFCDALLSDLQMIRQAAAEIPLEEPSPVVWANIRAQLDAEGAFHHKESGWRGLFSGISFPRPVPVGILASLIVIASALSVPNFSRLGSPESAPASLAAATAGDAFPGEDGNLAQVVGDLETNYRANEASLAPELKATYEASLISLNGSIRECLDSLHHKPGNTLAHEYLLTAYTRKAEILSSALEFEGVNGR